MQKLIIILLFPMFSFSQFDYNEYVTSNYIEKMTCLCGSASPGRSTVFVSALSCIVSCTPNCGNHGC